MRLKDYRRVWFDGAAIVFLLLASWQLGLPGPHYDEAIEVVPAIQLLRGMAVTAHRGAGIRIGGTLFPIMVVDYIGALNTYLVIPFFLVGGIGVPSMRAMPIAAGLVALYFTFRLADEWAGERAGILAALFLAVQPSFVFWTRQGIFVTSITTPILMAFLWFAWRWWNDGRSIDWLLLCFLAGLGIYAKFLFVWPIGALLVIVAAVWRWERPKRLPGARELAAGGIAFLAGIWPLVLFNIQTGGTFKHFTEHLVNSYYGVHNTAYFHNLLVRFDDFRSVVEGDHFWYLGGVHRDTWALAAFLLFPLIALAGKRSKKAIARVLIPLAMIAVVIIESPMTPSSLWVTHYAIITPLIAFSLAVSSDGMLRLVRGRWLAVAALVVVLLLGKELATDIQYHRSLAKSGGLGDHSDAIYHLAYWLQTHGKTSPPALDWGMSAPVFLLTKGQVAPQDIFGYENLDEPGSGFRVRVSLFLHDPRQVFLLHSPNATVFKGRREVFEKQAAKFGLKPKRMAVFSERSGRPLIEVWTVSPK